MTKHFLTSLLLFAGATAALKAGIDAPQVGIARHADGTVHSIYGMHANFIYGRQMFSLAQAASFSDQAGLLSIRGQVELTSNTGAVLGSVQANEANPLLSVEGDVNSALAWLPTQQALLFYSGSSFSAISLQGAFAGTVTSLSRQGTSAHLYVMAADATVSRVDIDLHSGNVTNVEQVPGISGAVFFQQSFLLFHDSNGLEVVAPDNSIRTLPIAATDLSYERISSSWLHLRSAAMGQDWALHLDSTALELSELPAPPATVPSQRRIPLGVSPPVSPIRGVSR